MSILGANVAVIHQKQILLTKREDFEVWCLPGGAVEAGESVAQAAVREVYEETGLKVELEELVGVYSKLGFLSDVHAVVFTGHVIGGELRVQPGETVELRFFGLEELPQGILFGQNRRILDALEGVRGIARTQKLRTSLKHLRTRQELYSQRDQSELSRRDFYVDLMNKLGPEYDELEVGKSR